MSGSAGLKRYINRADKKEGQSGGGPVRIHTMKRFGHEGRMKKGSRL